MGKPGLLPVSSRLGFVQARSHRVTPLCHCANMAGPDGRRNHREKNTQEWGKPGHSSGGRSILKKANKQKSLRSCVVLGVRAQPGYPCWVPSKSHRKKKQITLLFYPLNTKDKNSQQFSFNRGHTPCRPVTLALSLQSCHDHHHKGQGWPRVPQAGDQAKLHLPLARPKLFHIMKVAVLNMIMSGHA